MGLAHDRHRSALWAAGSATAQAALFDDNEARHQIAVERKRVEERLQRGARLTRRRHGVDVPGRAQRDRRRAAVVGALGLQAAEAGPGAGAEDPLFRHVVHVHRDAQHGGKGNQVRADVPDRDRAVVRAPVRHHGVGVLERAVLAIAPRGEGQGSGRERQGC